MKKNEDEDFLDNPRHWVIVNINLVIGFLFGLSVPFTAWILFLGFFKILPLEKSLVMGCILGFPLGLALYYFLFFL